MGDPKNGAICALLEAGAWEEALFECNVRLQVQPLTGRLHLFKGISLQKLDRLEEAEASFNRAYLLDTTLTEAGVFRAQCLEKLRRFREAMDLVKELTPLRPNDRVLEGLAIHLSQFYHAEEHDAWEKSRRFEAKSQRSSH